MKAKTLFTAAVLAFVAVSVVYLIVKEIRRAEAPEAAREAVSDPAPVETGGKEFETAGAETSAAPATPPASSDGALDEGTAPPAADRTVVITYYYTSKR
jgi:hypothetical protein